MFKKIINTFFQLSSNLLIVVVVLGGIAAVAVSYDLPGNYRLFTIVSGSMGMSMPAGSMVIVKPAPNYTLGEVITYRIKEARSPVTHRIVGINQTAKGVYYQVRGDANNALDSQPVPLQNILGKVIYSIPLIGYFVIFARTLPGLIILIIMPATLLIYSEILNIKREFRQILTRNTENNKKRFHVRWPILFFLLLPVGYLSCVQPSSAYFTSKLILNLDKFSLLFPPELTLLLTADRKEINLKVVNIKEFTKIKYELTYDSDSGKQGVIGGWNLNSENEFSRNIVLGVCTTGGTCSYHANITNIQVKVELVNNKGEVTLLQSNL